MVVQLKVLHISPHLGGGVGSVIREYLKFEVETKTTSHSVIALDSLDQYSKDTMDSLGICWLENCYSQYSSLFSAISDADIVLIHWWNHPLLQELLMNVDFPDCRMIVWSHISGNAGPNSFGDFILEFADRFIFTTPLSFASPEIQMRTTSQIQEIGCIWSTSGAENLIKMSAREVSEKRDYSINVGYVGNLDYSKLHSEFLNICQEVQKLGASITVVGPFTERFVADLSNSNNLKELVATGYVPERQKFELMQQFDVLLYPLSREHYGTCDQVIQEAMALGVIPVVLNNPMESLMVQHRRTGLVARNSQEIIDCIELLISDKAFRRELSMNAKNYARSKYSMAEMASAWKMEFDLISKSPKKSHKNLKNQFGRKLEPNEVFTHSLGIYAGVFLRHKSATSKVEKSVWAAQIASLSSVGRWASPTKSSATHYADFFTQDIWLREWSMLTSGKDMVI